MTHGTLQDALEIFIIVPNPDGNLPHDFQSSQLPQPNWTQLPRLPVSKSNPFGLAAKAAEAACTSLICSLKSLYYIVLHYIKSYHIVLYYIILYHIVSYCVILYYIILYYII